MHLGSTLDNALGEVYDKIARELNVSYVKEGVSGGEAVEELAKYVALYSSSFIASFFILYN